MSHKRVGLALGGGAARGLAHVGVLQVLEEAGVPVHCIAGTSVGALVGAAYAAGTDSGRLEEMANTMRWRRIARPIWPRNGLVSFARLEALMIDLIGDLSFDDLQAPCAAVATDLETGQAIVLQEGRVAPAVRASCSVPGFVAPVEMDGRLLTDGGISNNLPISVARDLGGEVVIAVDLMTPLGRRPKGGLEVAVFALRYLVARSGDDADSADVCIRIPLWSLGSLLRIKAGAWLIAVGRQATEEAMPAIRRVLESD